MKMAMLDKQRKAMFAKKNFHELQNEKEELITGVLAKSSNRFRQHPKHPSIMQKIPTKEQKRATRRITQINIEQDKLMK